MEGSLLNCDIRRRQYLKHGTLQSVCVKFKDRKSSLSVKKPQRVVALEKQPQGKILRCGCYSEDSEGFGLKDTCNLLARR